MCDQISDEFTYSITGPDAWLFTVTSEGVLKLDDDYYADREIKDTLNITITATDLNGLSISLKSNSRKTQHMPHKVVNKRLKDFLFSTLKGWAYFNGTKVIIEKKRIIRKFVICVVSNTNI